MGRRQGLLCGTYGLFTADYRCQRRNLQCIAKQNQACRNRQQLGILLFFAEHNEPQSGAGKYGSHGNTQNERINICRDQLKKAAV